MLVYLQADPLIFGVGEAETPSTARTTVNVVPSSFDGSVDASSATPELVNAYGRP